MTGNVGGGIERRGTGEPNPDLPPAAWIRKP